jgi:hypothetical protein
VTQREKDMAAKYSCPINQSDPATIFMTSFLRELNRYDSVGSTILDVKKTDEQFHFSQKIADFFISPSYFAKYRLPKESSKLNTTSGNVPERLLCVRNNAKGNTAITMLAYRDSSSAWVNVNSYALSTENGTVYILPPAPPKKGIVAEAIEADPALRKKLEESDNPSFKQILVQSQIVYIQPMTLIDRFPVIDEKH